MYSKVSSVKGPPTKDTVEHLRKEFSKLSKESRRSSVSYQESKRSLFTSISRQQSHIEALQVKHQEYALEINIYRDKVERLQAELKEAETLLSKRDKFSKGAAEETKAASKTHSDAVLLLNTQLTKSTKDPKIL